MKDKIKLMFSSIVALSVMVITLLVSTIVLAVSNKSLRDSQSDMADAQAEVYDFYLTLGTMPTLYATINAYNNKNPNTYMWFSRGNTISKEYSADFIHYFSTQSNTNAESEFDFFEIREKVREIIQKNPAAKFHLYCDDLRVRFIPDIFVAAGVEFEAIEVTLLSDGTGTYSMFGEIGEGDSESYDEFASQKSEFEAILKDYKDHRSNKTYRPSRFTDKTASELCRYAFFVSTYSNVNYWVQSPDYLVNNNSESMNDSRYKMNIVRKDPKAMYNSLNAQTKSEYQKVVLANALVGSDTLHTLEDAANYFNSQLSNRDKEVVLILGTNRDTKAQNESYINQTIEFYTPTLKAGDNTKVVYKGKEYGISAGATEVVVDGKNLSIGECAVYLFFKGHPGYPAKPDLVKYFEDNNIVMLPHRTPVEVLFWMYDVKVGGYQSTSFISTEKGQTEFFYGEPTTEALVLMKDSGFFDGTVIFSE